MSQRAPDRVASCGIGPARSIVNLTRSVLTPTFAVDSSGRVISINNQLAALLEIEPASAVGQRCSQICLAGPAEKVPEGCDQRPMLSFLQYGEGSETRTVTLLTGSKQALTACLTVIASEGGHLVVIGSADGRQAEPTRVRVSCFGDFSVQLPDGTPFQPRRPKTLTLLKLLLVERPQPVTEARIVGALWPDMPSARGLRGLRVLVHDLRHALEPGLTDGRGSRFVVRRSASYGISDDAPVEVDIDRFRASADRARNAAAAGRFVLAEHELASVLQLYRGDLFFPNLSASWFSTHQRRLRSIWLDMPTLHATLLSRTGRTDAALEQSQRVVDVDLLREDAHRLLLLSLARNSGRDAALKHFVDMTASFEERFELPPSCETSALASALLRGDDLGDLESAYIAIGEPTRVKRPAVGEQS